ncbi:Placenta-specific 8 protein [Tupaia chinensis]|uniref:Placenta-specific 8 protein n=1 Tax=Tupaia chinensis TaxID=246437 RepID=L9KMA7_TUPCH|nr:Placenta-specific 8 protein [Tupaia chinensis]
MQTQSPMVIVSQPNQVIVQNSNWQTGLCDCFSDCGVCLCGTFCFICLGCQVASDMNECCLCGTSVAMRTLYRTRYGIPVKSSFEATKISRCLFSLNSFPPFAIEIRWMCLIVDMKKKSNL